MKELNHNLEHLITFLELGIIFFHFPHLSVVFWLGLHSAQIQGLLDSFNFLNSFTFVSQHLT